MFKEKITAGGGGGGKGKKIHKSILLFVPERSHGDDRLCLILAVSLIFL